MFYSGILGLHSLLRWAIIILLLINISKSIFNKKKPYSKEDRVWNLRLIIITHINFLVGLYQYFFGDKGYALVKIYGMKDVMKNSNLRFWVVEHITGMLLAIVLITITSSISKKSFENDVKKHNKLAWFYIAALIIICAVIPWPFRTGLGVDTWFRSLY
jgi:uncharacterized membrane protein